MRKMFSNKKYHYYIAYCFTTEETLSGYGNITISNSKKLSIETLEDIQYVELFIKNTSKEKQNVILTNVVIMEWRQLKDK